MRLFAGTEFDRPPICPQCSRPEQECCCPPAAPKILPPEKQCVKIQLEKRKKGKTVTVLRGLDPTVSHLKDLLTLLKNHCGTGVPFRTTKLKSRVTIATELEAC